jgi:hypothetical protein
MTSELNWVIQVPLRCPHCREESVEMLGCLIEYDKLACNRCGGLINLATDEWRAYLKECADALGKIGTAFNKLP